MNALLPNRASAQRQLLLGAALVAVASLLNLIPIRWGVMGAPWPLFLLWPLAGWTTLGVNVTAACLIFALGLWLDLVTGGQLGMWALVGLLTYGLCLLSARIVSTQSWGPISNAAFTALIAMVVVALVSLISGETTGWLAMLVPCLGASLAYYWLASLFEFDEVDL